MDRQEIQTFLPLEVPVSEIAKAAETLDLEVRSITQTHPLPGQHPPKPSYWNVFLARERKMP